MGWPCVLCALVAMDRDMLVSSSVRGAEEHMCDSGSQQPQVPPFPVSCLPVPSSSIALTLKTRFSFQTVVLGILMRSIGNKNTILLGLGFQILQLAWYGFGSQPW